jgi:hypothetical protein
MRNGHSPLARSGPAVEHGNQTMMSRRLHAADGSVRPVLITAELSDDEPRTVSKSALLGPDALAAATGAWPVGQVVDLTTLRLSAVRIAPNHAISEAAEYRAVMGSGSRVPG